MRVQASFVLQKGQIERFNRVIAEYQRAWVLRRFILKEYELPNNLDEIASLCREPLQGESEIFVFNLSEEVINRIDKFVDCVNNYREKGVGTVSRSTIMRHVLECIISEYEKNPVQIRKWKKKLIHIPREQKELLKRYIKQREISAFLEEFILKEYIVSPVPAEILKRFPTGEVESLMITISEEVMDYITDVINSRFKDDNVKIMHILRDAITQLIKKLEQNQER
ncbi:MAG TPA: hypothetical protein VEY70_18465 [Metabacillus sp.]|nr:hypothetical protein [Metabacillus sp.]